MSKLWLKVLEHCLLGVAHASWRAWPVSNVLKLSALKFTLWCNKLDCNRMINFAKLKHSSLLVYERLNGATL
jgi:hypothetical protein